MQLLNIIATAVTLAIISARTGQGALQYVCQANGEVTFTIDEGPSQYTGALLDILAAKKVKAAFHVVTKYLNQAVPVANLHAMAADGHIIGIRLDPAVGTTDLNAMMQSLQGSVVELKSILPSANPKYVRLPFDASQAAVQAAESLGFVVSRASIDIGLYLPTANATNVFNALQSEFDLVQPPALPNFIIGVTDLLPLTNIVLPSLIDLALNRSLNVVMLDACLGRTDGLTSTNGDGGVYKNDGKDASAFVPGSSKISTDSSTSNASGSYFSTGAVIGASLVGLLYQFL